MFVRYLALLFGVLEILVPRRVVDFWMDLAVADGDSVELRPWVYSAARIEGIILVVWAVYRLQSTSESPTGETAAEWSEPVESSTETPGQERTGARDETTDIDGHTIDISGPDEAAEDNLEVGFTITPGTRKFLLAATLYHASENVTVNELVELYEGTEHEMTSSNVSAALYTMNEDGIVDRQKRGGDGSYEYWLSDAAVEVLEVLDEPLEPNPFPN